MGWVGRGTSAPTAILGSSVAAMQGVVCDTAFQETHSTPGQRKRVLPALPVGTVGTKGELQNTRWIVKFDVLRAEKVAEVGSSFSGATLGRLANTLLGGTAGSVVSQGASSVQTTDSAGVWIIGMRYKIIDARTTQQVAQGYAEDKLEVGSAGMSVLGMSLRQAGGTTLDALVIGLLQKNVADIDQKYK